jgi:hypothetical protein
MTASRARSSDIGSERENSRIGTRCVSALELPGLAPPVFEPPALEEFFRVIIMIRKKVHVSSQPLQRDYFCIAASVNWI